MCGFLYRHRTILETTMNVVEMLQAQFQTAAEKLQTTQKEYSK
jgi:hypothetical protein